MTVKIHAIQRGNPSNKNAPKKYYPSIESTGHVTTRELADEAAEISTLSNADMAAAIESFLTIIPQELSKGNIVELGDFGSFWIRIQSDGVDKEEDVQASQVTNVLPQFRPGKEFKQTLDGIHFSKQA